MRTLKVGLAGVVACAAVGVAEASPGPVLFHGVRAGDTASVSLSLMNLSGQGAFINAGGDAALVQRSGPMTDLGLASTSRAGGRIEASWEEILTGPGHSRIRFLIRTDLAFDQFAPVGASVAGQPAFAWIWHVGVSDPINFEPWVTSVTLNSATASFSTDQGVSFSGGTTDFTAALPANFMPGRDPGILIAGTGAGINALLLDYDVTIVPAPAGAAALGLAGLAAMRRRR